MHTIHRLLLGAAALLLALGCHPRAGVVTTSARADVRLVSVGPRAWVVADYPEPVFYANGVYWRYDGGVWSRSAYLGGGWATVSSAAVPGPILRIDRPRRYVRYTAPRGARVRVVSPGRARAPGARVRATGRARVRGPARARQAERRADRRRGSARRGSVRRGSARRGSARRGSARRGNARRGNARRDRGRSRVRSRGQTRSRGRGRSARGARVRVRP